MARFTQEQYDAYIRKRSQAGDKASGPKSEPVVRDDALGEAQGKADDTPRIVVCIVSFRCRLLDADNLVGGTKYFTDGLRYAGLISGDSPDKITLSVRQEKVRLKEEERTEITIQGLTANSP